jgi:hypothetical protein
LNTASNAACCSASFFAATVFHENFHAIQSTLGRLYTKKVHRKLGDLNQAGKLWHMMVIDSNGMVPHIISRPYRQQFHEVSAYKMDDKFESGIKQLVDVYEEKVFQAAAAMEITGRPRPIL